MPDSIARPSISQTKPSRPDYVELVKYLLEPFLEYPESLSIDCERLNQQQKVWLRLAFAETEKGRVYGRGGRNIKAIATVLQTAATAANQSLHLDIYEASSPDREKTRSNSFKSEPQRRKSRTRRSAVAKPSLKSRN